ncbi:MAG: DUF4198 domain-containing protein [Pseudomonadota bacterium]
MTKIAARPSLRLRANRGLHFFFSVFLAAGVGMMRATAHETWLLPGGAELEPGRTVEFLMTSGMGFPALGAGIDRSRILDAVLMQGAERQNLVPSNAFKEALELSAVPGPGLACSWVQLRPRILEIPEKDSVEHYLGEIGAGDEVYEIWRSQGEGSLWRESYGKLARNYLVVGERADAGEAGCISERSAARFDILPLSDPTELSSGDALEIQVLFDTKPLAGQAIGFVREGASPEELVRSDAEGRVRLTIRGSGLHMIYATNLRRASRAEDFNWESDFVTLSFNVEDL